MESQDSFIRSAAQATSSAYKRLPIRWRLAGGSAVLTLVILCGFAAIVGVLTTRQIESDFNRQVGRALNALRGHHIASRFADVEQIRLDDVEVAEHHIERRHVNLSDGMLSQVVPHQAVQVAAYGLMLRAG